MAKKLLKDALRLAVAAGVVVLVSPSGAFAADGILEGLARALDQAGRVWGPALLVAGGLIAGGSIMMGSHQSGEKVRNFIIGAIFAVLAAGGGAFILGKLQPLLN